VKILNIAIGILLLTFDLRMESCNSLDINISGYFNNCINLTDAQHDLIIEINNQSRSSLYINTTNLFFKMGLVSHSGEMILPNIKGGSPVDSKIILIKPGKHKYKLSLSGFDRYDLREEIYWMHIHYRNSQKSIQGKKLLVGEYEIPEIRLEICK